MKSPQEWARDCLQRIDLAGAEASASEVVAVIVGEAVAEAVREERANPAEWETADERTVVWNKEQTEHLRRRLASVKSLTWLPGPPAEPGMYWYRTPFAPTPTIMLVTDDGFDRLRASGLGGITLSSLQAGEWAGPLPMPPE